MRLHLARNISNALGSRIAPVTLLSLLLSSVPLSSPWTMQACILGSTLTVDQRKCSHGIWFSKPWELSAVCVDGGVWAVYQEWCQERPSIWTVYPDRHGCMQDSMLKNVLGIVYLGNDTDGGVISTRNQRLFLAKYGSDSNLEQWTLNDSQVDILVWGNSPFSVHEASAAGEQHKCLLKGRHAYSAGYSLPLKSRSNVTLSLIQEPCTSPPHKWNSYQLTPSRSDSVLIMSPQNENKEFHCAAPYNDTFDADLRSKSYKRNIENINFMEYSRSKDLLTPIDSARVNEQTERLARKLIAHAFLQEPLPDMNFDEWRFLLMAEEIFDVACPLDMVPKEFFHYMLIFYRFILIESFDKFPPQLQRDDETVRRIQNGLNNCMLNAKQFVFKDLDKCSLSLATLIAEYEHVNGTMEEVFVQLPDKVKFDTENFDLLLESAWKLMIFVHYYCADYFKEFPQDLSTLQHRWQELMAPDIMTRWQCPGKSYEMVRTLIRSIDLPTTLRHVDHCVAASHMYSVYPGWIKRPTPVHRKIKGKYIAEMPYGIKPELYPIGAADADFDLFQSKIGASYNEPEWDGQTYCLKDYLDPKRELGYSTDNCRAAL